MLSINWRLEYYSRRFKFLNLLVSFFIDAIREFTFLVLLANMQLAHMLRILCNILQPKILQ